MDEKELNRKILNLVDSNFNYLEECANDAIIALNRLLGQMHYYNSLSNLHQNLSNTQNFSDK